MSRRRRIRPQEIDKKPWYRRRSTWWTEEVVRRYNLTEAELNALADYNTERHRGIVHAEAVQARMAELQRRYDEAVARLY